MKKTKVAFIKFAGLASGGTEKFLQTIAANLPKEKFDVDYYYTNAAPYINSDYKHAPNDEENRIYLEKNNVNLVEVFVEYKNITVPTHDWINSNLFSLFNEENYDVVVTGRAGHKEYPFNFIEKTPIIEIVTLPGMCDNQKNIFKSVHISKFQADSWIKAGGDSRKVKIIPLFSDEIINSGNSLREELNIPKDDFVFGMHQRVDNGIVSFIPLEAYKEVMNDKTWFIILGGGDNYKKFAEANGLKNFIQLEHGNNETIDKFLSTLNVWAGGRKDGETFGHACAQALSRGLPIVHHLAPANGHIETIGPGGVVCSSVDDYIKTLKEIQENKELCQTYSKNGLEHYNKNLSLNANMKKIIDIFDEIEIEKEKENMSDEDFWNSMW